MADLQYYRMERERHPELQSRRCSFREASTAILKLGRHYKVDRWPLRIHATSGNRHSRASRHIIYLNTVHLNWLTVMHEFAHTWHQARIATGRSKHTRRWHGKAHARLVDRACAYITKKGWHEGVLERKAEERDRLRLTRTALAARPVVAEIRIQRRREQIKRIETKIKRLRTSHTKASRSLRALERHHGKRLTEQGGSHVVG